MQNKDGALAPLQLNTVQQALTGALTGRDLVLKARHVGISTALQATLFWHTQRGNVRTLTLCHEDDLTQEIRAMVDRFYNNLPDHSPVRKFANATLTTYPELNSQARIATVGGTTGSKKGRGGSVTHIHGSEVAFWPDAAGVMAAAMQAGHPAIYLESTPNGAQGYFYTLVMEALDGNSDWTLHFFPWWMETDYTLPLTDGEPLTLTDEEQALCAAHGLTQEQINWRRAKQRELKHLFIQEYPEDPLSCFLLSGTGYFGDLSSVFVAPTGAAYDPDHRYYCGLDWGQANDFTAASVIDKTALVEVEVLRLNKLPWSEIRRQVRLLCDRWHCETITPETNSMGPNIEELYREFEVGECETTIIPFTTTNNTKYDAAVNLYEALHEGGLKLLPDSVSKRELLAFQASQTSTGLWRLAAAEGEHDDTAIAKLLAWVGTTRGRGFV